MKNNTSHHHIIHRGSSEKPEPKPPPAKMPGTRILTGTTISWSGNTSLRLEMKVQNFCRSFFCVFCGKILGKKNITSKKNMSWLVSQSLLVWFFFPIFDSMFGGFPSRFLRAEQLKGGNILNQKQQPAGSGFTSLISGSCHAPWGPWPVNKPTKKCCWWEGKKSDEGESGWGQFSRTLSQNMRPTFSTEMKYTWYLESCPNTGSQWIPWRFIFPITKLMMIIFPLSYQGFSRHALNDIHWCNPQQSLKQSLWSRLSSLYFLAKSSTRQRWLAMGVCVFFGDWQFHLKIHKHNFEENCITIRVFKHSNNPITPQEPNLSQYEGEKTTGLPPTQEGQPFLMSFFPWRTEAGDQEPEIGAVFELWNSDTLRWYKKRPTPEASVMEFGLNSSCDTMS